MKRQPSAGNSLFVCQLKCTSDQLSAVTQADSVRNDFPRKQIDNHADIVIPVFQFDAGDITNPDFVGRIYIKTAMKKIGCDYGIHFYGPYSADLDFAVRELNDEGILKIDYTPMEHLISVVGDSFENGNINPTVNEVIDEFSKETPSELELIATALYVYLQVKDVSRIKTEVIKIKGSKYSGSRIDSAIGRLKATGYIVE